jgi:BirA family biotin operon repressor/biotin-[acetyl-CoA-carboxylase] ligase
LAGFCEYLRAKINHSAAMALPPIGHNLHILPQVDSTNLYAMEQVTAGLAAHGDVFAALEQTAGQGQRGRKWVSNAGDSILLSAVINPRKLTVSQHFRLSASLALAAIDYLSARSNGVFHIKWPNDLYWGDRKAGGILIQNVIAAGRWQWAIAGIGINLNQVTFDDHLPNPVSLRQITGQAYQAETEAQLLCTAIEKRWLQMQQGPWATILAEYNNLLYGAGTIVKFRRNGVVTPLRIYRVDGQGHLIVGENQEYQFSFGEVEWIPKNKEHSGF